MSRKPAAYPMFLKKFRGTEEEQAEFLKMLPGDAREDFEQVVKALKPEMSEKERADRLEAMVDRMSEKLSDCVLLILPMRELCLQIERCGASEELTKAVVMASDIQQKLMDAVGVKQLPAGTK